MKQHPLNKRQNKFATAVFVLSYFRFNRKIFAVFNLIDFISEVLTLGFRSALQRFYHLMNGSVTEYKKNQLSLPVQRLTYTLN